MKDTLKQEFTRRISVANSTDLIVILYDMVLSYADDAEEDFVFLFTFLSVLVYPTLPNRVVRKLTSINCLLA